MSRLIRMDHTGHTTLAEWTAEDPVSAEAAVARVPSRARAGLFRRRLTGRRARRAGPRAAARRPAGDHAPPDRRRLIRHGSRTAGPRTAFPAAGAGRPGASRARQRPLAQAGRRALAPAGRACCGRRRRSPTRCRSSPSACCWPRSARSCCRSRSSAWPTRGRSPSCTPRAARAWSSRGPSAAAKPERVALGLLGDLVDHRARDLHARTGLILERGRSASGWSARRAHSWSARAAGACTAIASG